MRVRQMVAAPLYPEGNDALPCDASITVTLITQVRSREEARSHEYKNHHL